MMIPGCSRTRRAFLFCLGRVASLILLALSPLATQAADKTPPLKVLFITGGGYHDYKALNPVLTKKISELAQKPSCSHSCSK